MSDWRDDYDYEETPEPYDDQQRDYAEEAYNQYLMNGGDQ
jgi:hypothetical protein